MGSVLSGYSDELVVMSDSPSVQLSDAADEVCLPSDELERLRADQRLYWRYDQQALMLIRFLEHHKEQGWQHVPIQSVEIYARQITEQAGQR